MRRPEQVGVLGLRQSATLDLAIENVPTELRRRRVLFVLEPLPDLVARAPRPHVSEPVATRPRRRRAVRISTVSEFFSARDSGAILPLIFAPWQCSPTSVCTAKAKSIGVAPFGEPNRHRRSA